MAGKDNTIIGLMKAVLNCTEPMTEKEQDDFLDTVYGLLRRRRIQRLKRIFRCGK